MATDVKNKSGGNTGSAQNGRITVKGSRSNHQHQDPQAGVQTYLLSKFDSEGPVLADRFDDPRYYQGDATT